MRLSRFLLSCQRKDWWVGPCQSFIRYGTEYKFLICSFHRLYCIWPISYKKNFKDVFLWHAPHLWIIPSRVAVLCRMMDLQLHIHNCCDSFSFYIVILHSIEHELFSCSGKDAKNLLRHLKKHLPQRTRLPKVHLCSFCGATFKVSVVTSFWRHVTSCDVIYCHDVTAPAGQTS